MKKYILGFLIVVILLGIIINYRTPFYPERGGAWSIGFGSFKGALTGENVLKNITIYSKERLQELDGSTRFLADPFFVKEKDTFYVFFEHQKQEKNAVISLITSHNGQDFTYKGQVLKEKFHLSYPYVFKYRGEYFMLPETKKANNILLYKSYNFPYDWRIYDTLVKNVRLKDPSIFLSDTLNIMVTSDDDMNLYMYKADSLFSTWRLHEKSIVSRGTESRPGGSFFMKNGKLMLPIQNSTKGYGYGISLYQFDFKDDDYTIQKRSNLFLKRQDTIEEFSFGMHHANIQIIDGQYYYVVDGNEKADKKRKINVSGPLKWNWIDLMNWINTL